MGDLCKAKNSKEIFVHGRKKKNSYTMWGQKKKFMKDKNSPRPSSLF